METVTLRKEMDAQEFWENIFGSINFTYDWWIRVKYEGDADWHTPGQVTLTIDDGEGGKLTKTIGMPELLDAYDKCIGKYLVDIDNMDEDSSDVVLQMAMFDDVVYG